MTEERLTTVEQQVGNLRVSNAELAKSVEHLSTAVAALTLTVQTLRDTINTGRGALWVIAGAAGTLGAIFATVFKKAFGLV